MAKLSKIFCAECSGHCGYTWSDAVPTTALCFSCAHPIAELMQYLNLPSAPKFVATIDEPLSAKDAQMAFYEFQQAFTNFKYYGQPDDPDFKDEMYEHIRKITYGEK